MVSRRPEIRGDGIKYKPHPTRQGKLDGGQRRFRLGLPGRRFHKPPRVGPRLGCSDRRGHAGNYWEAHANFPQTYNGYYQTMPPGCVSRVCSCFPANGRNYYHDRLMFEHLAQTPEYGPMFIAKLWYDGATETEKNPYPWLAFTRLNPYPNRSLADEYTRMTMRNVTWDYTPSPSRRATSGTRCTAMTASSAPRTCIATMPGRTRPRFIGMPAFC